MKMLWEKLDKFDAVIQTADSSFQFPRQGDKFLMLVFMEQGHSREALIRLNWVRLHLQIIFLSDILLASGQRIDGITAPKIRRESFNQKVAKGGAHGVGLHALARGSGGHLPKPA
jgi:hypothetical protein